MALQSIDFNNIESMAYPLLTADDEQRILEAREFDYHVEPFQENYLSSQNVSEDETQVLELILEEESNSQVEISEQDFNGFFEFLTRDYDDSIEIASNCEVTSCNDSTIKDFNCCNISADQGTNSCAVGEKYKEKPVKRTKTKGELKEIQNEQDKRCKNKPIEITHPRRRSSKGKTKPRMLQNADFPDEKVKLDEFLMKLLDDEQFSSFIHWTYREGKEFKLVNAGQVANLWGKLRGKKKFTSDKLLREMRHLRNNGLMLKLERKDHFKFS